MMVKDVNGIMPKQVVYNVIYHLVFNVKKYLVMNVCNVKMVLDVLNVNQDID